jgi:hypothetical protein
MTSTENNDESIDELFRQLAIDIKSEAKNRDVSWIPFFIAGSSSLTLIFYENTNVVNGYSVKSAPARTGDRVARPVLFGNRT